jgi:hypothetical protein
MVSTFLTVTILQDCLLANGIWRVTPIEFLTTDPEIAGSIPSATKFSEKYWGSGERCPFSLVRIIEELLEWQSRGSGLENRD